MKGSKLKTSSKRDRLFSSSYYGKHVQKSKIGQGELQKSTAAFSEKWNEAEIAHRRQQIIVAMHKKQEKSIIRIEDSPSDFYFSKHTHPELQSIWQAKIAQVRQKLESVGKQITDEQRITEQRQRELSEKKTKHAALMEKQQHFSRRLQEQVIQEEAGRSQYSQTQQIRSKDKQNQQELNYLKEDQKVLVEQVKQMSSELAYLQKQYRKLESSQETQETIEDLNELIEENERIKQSITKLENENLELQTKIQELEGKSTPAEELYRRFTGLYEKIFIGREIEKVQRLMQAKELLFKRQEDFERNKSLLKERKKDIIQRQKKIQDKEKLVQKLTLEILQVSNRMLLEN